MPPNGFVIRWRARYNLCNCAPLLSQRSIVRVCRVLPTLCTTRYTYFAFSSVPERAPRFARQALKLFGSINQLLPRNRATSVPRSHSRRKYESLTPAALLASAVVNHVGLLKMTSLFFLVPLRELYHGSVVVSTA